MSNEKKTIDDLAKEQEQQKQERKKNREEREKLIERAKELEEEKKNQPIRLKTKPVPTVVTLVGGAIAAIIVCIQHYELHFALVIILISLLVFLVIGDVIKYLLDKIELPRPVEEQENVGEDGEMIEKGPAGEGEEAETEVSYDEGNEQTPGETGE